MKTKLLLISLFSLVLLSACTTDDRILETQAIALEAIDQNALNTNSCNYLNYIIPYPSSTNYLPNSIYARVYRDSIKKVYYNNSNCLIYRFPKTVNFINKNGIYYEKIEKLTIYDPDDSNRNNCNYRYFNYTITYPSSPYYYLPNSIYARVYRDSIKKVYVNNSGCLKYLFPDNLNFINENGVYSENIKIVIIGKPLGDRDDIEL